MEPGAGRTANTIACRFGVSGRVQGVGFRAFVVRAARSLALDGYVRNAPDGSVEVWAEGPAAALDQLAVELRRGPSHAHVTSVERSPAVASGTLAGFEVRH